ncbi:MAG TPA: response regulator transcription factor [Roseiflexaceae bacterium]|jgi:DNA-binding NarL/FixJ family response regulator|nr:response regulator transcription factor [Roseiflexaceae bacterium]
MKIVRIFLADDHAVVREGLKTLINAQPDMEVVGEAADGHSAVHATGTCQPDIVIMDISMPRLNGIQATAELKRTSPHVKVLALSVHEDTSYLQELMHAGASGYVLKRAAADALIQAVRTVAAGGVYLDPPLATRMVNRMSESAMLPNNAPTAMLSEREADVLRLIAQGYSNKEIATQLNLSIKTVETYKTRAMEKLHLGSRVGIVRYAVRQGWLH